MLDSSRAATLLPVVHDGLPDPGIITVDDVDEWQDVPPGDPCILRKRIVDQDAVVPCYGDDRWNLNALGRKPGAETKSVRFISPDQRKQEHSEATLETSRRVAWLLINRGVHPVSLSRPLAQAKRFLDSDSIRGQVTVVRNLLAWGEANGLEHLRDFTVELLDQYRREDQAKRPGVWANGRRACITRIADLAPWLPEPDRLVVPSWANVAREPKAVSGAPKGSRTEVIPEAMLDPLLAWSVCLIREAGPDIVAALEAVDEKVRTGRDGGDDEINAWLDAFVERHGALPRAPQATWENEVLFRYLAYASGFTEQAVRRNVQTRSGRNGNRYAKRRPVSEMSCPVRQPITGAGVDGRPWCASIDWCDLMPYSTWSFLTSPLIRSVYAAAYVLIGCGTTARPQEVGTLPLDCLEELPSDEVGGVRGHILHGYTWKNKGVGGEPKDWHAVEILADAVKLLQALGSTQTAEKSRLFPAGGVAQGRGDFSGNCWDSHAGRKALDEMTAYINSERIQSRLANPVRIEDPDDPQRLLRPRQFRRSFDIYTQRQPDGEFASMLTLGHSERGLGRNGYSSSASAGVTYGMTPGQKEAHAETLMEVGQVILDGAGVSGPSADRLIEASRQLEPFRARYEHKESSVKRLVKEHAEVFGENQVFNNPRQYSMCLYDPSRAKCQGTQDAPDRNGCDSGCDCHARTDREIGHLESEVGRLRVEASSPLVPLPMQVRLGQVADRHQAMLDEHRGTRRVLLPIVETTSRNRN